MMAIKCIAPWYGSNRMLAKHVGEALRGCNWVGVPFAGGLSEVREIKARTMLVSDLHRHVINLAMVIADPEKKDELVAKLESVPVHPDTLRDAQLACVRMESGMLDFYGTIGSEESERWAVDYFICAWMARNATSGTDREFDAKIATRWNASGGDSAVRFRNAIKSLDEWQKVMQRCSFVCLDVFDFLLKVKDRKGHGVYCDPPFFKVGKSYKHNCGDTETEQIAWHTKLRNWLGGFSECRIVCRFYDVPLIRELYPTHSWDWTELEGRKQTNDSAPEVLICRN